MKKYRFEFVYNNKIDQTLIVIWSGMRIIDRQMVEGQLTKEQEEKIQKDLLKKIKEED